VDRDNEDTIHSVAYSAEPALDTSWELRGSRLAARLGPQLKRVYTTYSITPTGARVDTLRLIGSLGWMSHFFEYYSGEPQEGYNIGLEGWTQAGRLLSQKTIHKLLFRHELLFNLGGWDPPLLVLGWRGYEGTYFYNPRDLLVNDVAPVDRFFLGGDDNIRGFGRQKLAGRLGLGYLTVFYEGFELRAVDWLPFKLQPFVFFDIARAGMTTETIDSPLYTAPGLGIRWSSPVGTLRFSLARGFSSRQLPEDPIPNLQFFVSFGKEF
jgi:translocation and assembly module TamA